jgi:membrane associated rhomboid family serine protease
MIVNEKKIKKKEVVKEGEYWRMISSIFSHYSIIHLLFNMATLWSYGYMEYINN